MYEPIVSKNIRLRRSDLLVKLGIGTIIDDFCYISTMIQTGRFVHIAANCTLAGGSSRMIYLGDFAGISASCCIYTGTELFDRDVTTIIPEELLHNRDTYHGNVSFENYCTVGANSVVMPGNLIKIGIKIILFLKFKA